MLVREKSYGKIKNMRSKKIKILQYNAIFMPEAEGGYSVSVPDLPGCHSQGETFEEAKMNIAEAIKLYLEDADENLYHITPEESQKNFMAPVTIQFHA